MNSINLVGRVIAMPETRFNQGGTSVTKTSISVDRGTGKKDANGYRESDVFRIEVWGKSGEALQEHIKKGDALSVTGRLETKKVDDGKGYWVTVADARWNFVPKPSQDTEAGF